jgi:hypothetical protein
MDGEIGAPTGADSDVSRGIHITSCGKRSRVYRAMPRRRSETAATVRFVADLVRLVATWEGTQWLRVRMRINGRDINRIASNTAQFVDIYDEHVMVLITCRAFFIM